MAAPLNIRARWIIFIAIMCAIAAIPIAGLYFPFAWAIVAVPILIYFSLGSFRAEMRSGRTLVDLIDSNNRPLCHF